jgi:hypothetical protein
LLIAPYEYVSRGSIGFLVGLIYCGVVIGGGLFEYAMGVGARNTGPVGGLD